MTLEDIEFAEGSNNTPGLIQSVMFIPLSIIVKDRFPKVKQPDPTGAGVLADLVTVTGDIFLKTGTKPTTIYLTDETGELKDEIQGELDGKSFSNMLEFLHPGEGDDIRGFAAYIKNNSGIFVVRSKEDKQFLFGSMLSPAKLVTGPGTMGKATKDRKGRTFTFKFDAGYPTPTFTGRVRDERNTSASGDDLFYDLISA